MPYPAAAMPPIFSVTLAPVPAMAPAESKRTAPLLTIVPPV